MSTFPTQAVRFFPLAEAPLSDLLELQPPPLIPPESSFRQLKYVEDYVRDPEIGCSYIVVEQHYIDRDYMEDHSVFYSRSLLSIPNYCKRIHFFRGAADAAEKAFDSLRKESVGKSSVEYRRECATFSDEHYLGFAVIKPLPGTPVGRTVLRPFPTYPPNPTNPTDPSLIRAFEAIRPYRAHLLGLELTVNGIAFQQQDVGVAACATTAIWTALQKNREHEELSPTTPAHITAKATHGRMPFGRSMPSEGLSVDQMCQAVEAYGISPVLTRVSGFASARDELYSAVRSAQVPVLIIQDANDKDRNHAVTVVGMKLLADQPKASGSKYDRASDRLEAVYIHDDRFGPYLYARLVNHGNTLAIDIRRTKAAPVAPGTRAALDEFERWWVKQILVPTHAKIRLSFHDLSLFAIETTKAAIAAWETLASADENTRPFFEVWTTRSFTYLEQLVLGQVDFAPGLAQRIQGEVALARYLGVIRITLPDVGTMDLLVDTTSTHRNPAFLACVCSKTSNKKLEKVAVGLGGLFECNVFFSSAAR